MRAVLGVFRPLLSAALLLPAGLLLSAGPVQALQVLEAADHAELEAEISSTAVNRVALENDRIVRVIQAPGGLVVEHDPVRGDVYLRVNGGVAGASPGMSPDTARLTLYLGTERGLTYRLSLNVTERDSAQILIRNDAAAHSAVDGASTARPGGRADARLGETVELIRAVARRKPPPGYAIVAGPATGGYPDDGHLERVRDSALTVLEIWRGARYTARVLTVPSGIAVDAEELAAGTVGNAVAAWVSGTRGDGDGARRAVVVELTDRGGLNR